MVLADAVDGAFVLGELSLHGGIEPVSGVLLAAILAVRDFAGDRDPEAPVDAASDISDRRAILKGHRDIIAVGARFPAVSEDAENNREPRKAGWH